MLCHTGIIWPLRLDRPKAWREGLPGTGRAPGREEVVRGLKGGRKWFLARGLSRQAVRRASGLGVLVVGIVDGGLGVGLGYLGL